MRPEIFSFPVSDSSGNLEHGHSEAFNASSSFVLTFSDKTTAKGLRRSKVRRREISPVFSLRGQNVPPNLHVAVARARVTGELGIRTARRWP